MKVRDLNLANQLTIARIALVPLLILCMYLDHFPARVMALIIFVAAAVTDIYDGIIARRQNTVTTLGIFLDPLADKLIISAALISFVGLRELHIPAWAVTLIISREFIITGLRSMAASRTVIIPASRAGKFKTTSQIVTIITILLILIVNSRLHEAGLSSAWLSEQAGWRHWAGECIDHLPFWLVMMTTFLTVTSGWSYLKANRAVLTE